MTLQFAIELLLALAAVLLLLRDLLRAWEDRLRRPVTLLAAAGLGLGAGGPAPEALRFTRADRLTGRALKLTHWD